MQATTAGTTQISQLPEALMSRILQSVQLHHRLANCSLVCKAWAAAAMQATTEVHTCFSAEHVASLQLWLQQHADQLSKRQHAQPASTTPPVLASP